MEGKGELGRDGKCSLETLSTLHADGHRFGKTKWRAVAKGRTKKEWNGEGGGGREGERKRKRKRLVGAWDRDSHKIDSLCAPYRHRPPLSHSLSFSLCASSPNFVANLRATKSAPFDFTLIRCQCRAVDEANLSLIYQIGYRRGFHFPRSMPFLSRQAGLFQGNYFPSLFGSVPTRTLYRSCISLRPPLLSPVSACSLLSLSLFLFLLSHSFFFILSRSCLS